MNIIATLFNLGGPDLLILLVAVLILFGPKKLPELARGLRQAMDEFNKAKHEVERELTRPEVAVQPAPGQQPRQPDVLPPAPAAIAPAPVAYAPAPAPVAYAPAPAQAPVAYAPAPVAPVAPAPPQPVPVEETHPAGQV
jgi:sec-independent protein translocase protein TatA